MLPCATPPVTGGAGLLASLCAWGGTMAGWFARWLGRWAVASQETTQKPSPPSAVGDALLGADADNPEPEGPHGVSSDARAFPPVVGAGVDDGLMKTFSVRRPLIGPDGHVAGFEFRLHDALGFRLRTHAKALSAYAAALMSAAQSTVDAGRSVLLTLSGELVLRSSMAKLVPAGAWLVAQPWGDAGLAEPALVDLRSRRVRVGCVLSELQSERLHPDFVLLSWDRDHPDALWDQINDLQTRQPSLPLVVTEIDNIDDLERVLRYRVALACGRLESGLERSAAVAHRPVQPGTVRLSLLLNEVMTVETQKLAADISSDVVLSYKLLRFANSPALGLSRAIDSIDQAVMVLGRKELYRWISILLLASADGLKASRALQEVALWRGRLMEGLATLRDRAEEPPSALFTVGLLSLLDVMLQVPLQQALLPLRLSDAAIAALLDRSGPWASYLLLALALETHQTDTALNLANEFGGLAKVLEISDEAWRWAAEATGHSHAAPQE